MLNPPAATVSAAVVRPKPGDLIGFSGHDLSGAFINLATLGIPFWSLSHVGIMAETASGFLLCYESTMLCDLKCYVQRKQIAGVQAHRLADRVEGYNGKVWHYPLKAALTPNRSRELSAYLNSNLGVAYDAMGAFRTSGKLFNMIEAQLRPENLESLFCSELCAAAHREVGVLHDDNVSRWSPNRLVRTERASGLLLPPIRLK